jgi:hypothetical protein
MKIRPVGAELFRAVWLTDTTKLTVAFRDIANALKNEWNEKLPVMLTQKFLSAHFHDLQLFKNCTTKKRRLQCRDTNITRLLFTRIECSKLAIYNDGKRFLEIKWQSQSAQDQA